MSFPERKRLLPVFSEKKQDANCAVPLRFERTHRLPCLTPFRAADRKTSWKTGDGSSCTVPLVIWIVYYSLRKISVRLAAVFPYFGLVLLWYYCRSLNHEVLGTVP